MHSEAKVTNLFEYSLRFEIHSKVEFALQSVFRYQIRLEQSRAERVWIAFSFSVISRHRVEETNRHHGLFYLWTHRHTHTHTHTYISNFIPYSNNKQMGFSRSYRQKYHLFFSIYTENQLLTYRILKLNSRKKKKSRHLVFSEHDSRTFNRFKPEIKFASSRTSSSGGHRLNLYFYFILIFFSFFGRGR